MTNDHTESAPLSPEIRAAFEGLAPSDVVPRSAPDPDALRALHAIPAGSAVTLRMVEMTEHGLQEIEIAGLYGGNYTADNRLSR